MSAGVVFSVSGVGARSMQLRREYFRSIFQSLKGAGGHEVHLALFSPFPHCFEQLRSVSPFLSFLPILRPPVTGID